MRATRPNCKLAGHSLNAFRLEPPPPRRLGPALLLALIAHVGLGLALAVWRLGAAPVVGCPLPPLVWSDQTVLLEGGDTGSTICQLPSNPIELPELPKIPETKIALPPSETKFETVPVETIAITGPTLATWVISAPFDSKADSIGAGPGAGSGAGAGQSHASAGNGTGDGFGNHAGGNGIPIYVRNPKPRYPTVARQQGWQGTTVVRVEVRADGRAGTVQVTQSSGHQVLDEAAMDAVRHARFRTAAKAWVEVPITFRLAS